MRATLERIIRRHGRLDGAFNHAGVLEGLFLPSAQLPDGGLLAQ